MKPLPTTLLALALAACSDAAPLQPLDPGQPSRAAVALTINEVEPFELANFVPCALGGAGEEIFLTGSLHHVYHVTLTPSGNVRVKEQFNPQSLSGVGLTSGDKYQGTGGTKNSFSLHAGETVTYVNNFRMIGQGPGNDLLVHENAHLTVDANGNVRSDHDNFSFECR